MSSDPIIFIGPGSEWFWSMAQFVVVVVTLGGIYYQLRLQRSANAFEQVNRLAEEWASEAVVRSKLAAARSIFAGDRVPAGSFITISQYWEKVAGLVRRGHVESDVVNDSLGNACRFWWALLEDDVRRARSGSESSDLMVHFEWLAAEFGRIAQKQGTTWALDRASLVQGLPEDIQRGEDQIRVFEEMRGSSFRPRQ